VADRSEEPCGVVVAESGDGVAEVDGDACGEAGRQQEDAAFAARNRGGLRRRGQ
jgi:hypothetical protein